MARHLRSVAGAPAPIGPYSTVVEANGFVFTSGQGPLPPGGGDMPEGTEEQTRLTMENLKAILTDLGLTFDNVVKTNIFLIDMGDFSAVNEVYASYFTSNLPARTTVAAAALPRPEMRVEIEMVAAR
ncbi:MAG: Rid family detoxifying hydrolase [bacterium]